MIDFVKTMGRLRELYDIDPYKLPNNFWLTIDELPNEVVFMWVERLLQIQGLLLGKDYLRVVGIQHDYRQYKSYTKKQKRSIMMDLIQHWYDVEFRYELS
jgi:hypothetical protein